MIREPGDAASTKGAAPYAYRMYNGSTLLVNSSELTFLFRKQGKG
jgi:hypothetical protein